MRTPALTPRRRADVTATPRMHRARPSPACRSDHHATNAPRPPLPSVQKRPRRQECTSCCPAPTGRPRLDPVAVRAGGTVASTGWTPGIVVPSTALRTHGLQPADHRHLPHQRRRRRAAPVRRRPRARPRAQEGRRRARHTARGCAPKHPAWVYGLRRAEQVDLEVPGDPVRTVRVWVDELEERERAEMWPRFIEMSSGFAEYEKTSEGRVFPIFRLVP